MDEKTKEFGRKVRRYRTLQAKQAALKSEMDELKEDIIQYMIDNDVTEFHGNNFDTKLSERTRYSFDKDALEDVFGANLCQYQKPVTFTVLMVK